MFRLDDGKIYQKKIVPMVHCDPLEQPPPWAPIIYVANKRFAASYGFIDTSVDNTGVFYNCGDNDKCR